MKFPSFRGWSCLPALILAVAGSLCLASPAASVETATDAVAHAASTRNSLPSGGEFAIRRQSIGTGARRASGGAFELVGTVGQAAVGKNQGARLVRSGFHLAMPLEVAVFADGFEATSP